MRYALFQIPDLLILVLILLVLRWWIDPRSWVYAAIVGIWIIKDVFTFPLVWRAYDRPQPGNTKSLIGTEGITEEQLNPSGYIRVNGELWQAKVMGKNAPIEKGEAVLIEGVYGLTLLVQRPERDDIREVR